MILKIGRQASRQTAQYIDKINSCFYAHCFSTCIQCLFSFKMPPTPLSIDMKACCVLTNAQGKQQLRPFERTNLDMNFFSFISRKQLAVYQGFQRSGPGFPIRHFAAIPNAGEAIRLL